MVENKSALSVEINGCARCGEDRRIFGFNFWALCPETEAPVLLKIQTVVDDDGSIEEPKK